MRPIYLPASILLLAANALVILRMTLGDVHLASVRPTLRHYLTLQLEAVLHGEPATLRAFVPADGPHQTITSEKVESARLAYSLVTAPPNRQAVWTAQGIEGHELATYDAIVQVRPVRYEIPDGVAVPAEYPPGPSAHLEATDVIQSDAPEIRDTVRRLLGSEDSADVATTIRALYAFVQEEIRGSDYESTLDAVTTLKWGEAFCGGKSRLLAALLRAANIPARLVGGLILTPGSKRQTHVWVEAWVNGLWIPFDPLNRHFAEHPANYLVLYHGDESQFSHTSDINFQYTFQVKRWRTSPDESLEGRGGLLNSYVFWSAFRKAHISLNLLRIILLLPIGVLAVVFFKNVVGMATFGVFHPALMAVAFRETGLVWGLVLYVAVLSAGLGLRIVLDRVDLLHTPRLSIVLVFVVALMLAVTYGSVRAGVLEPAHISLFPIAILTLTIESFFIRSTELGLREAISGVGQTLLVVVIVYLLIDSFFVQAVVFAFPEVLLGVVAANLVIGRWTGLRFSEYRRFRPLWAG